MNDQTLLRWWGFSAAAVVIAATPAWLAGPRAVAGVLIGGLWNLASLWCLVRLLSVWIGPQPSRRRAIGWLLAKLSLLALLIFGIIRAPWLSPVGFGVGFTVALVVVVWAFASHARRLVPPPARFAEGDPFKERGPFGSRSGGGMATDRSHGR